MKHRRYELAKKKAKSKLKLKPGHYRQTLVLDQNRTEILQAYGREDERSLSWMVRQAIDEAVHRREKKK